MMWIALLGQLVSISRSAGDRSRGSAGRHVGLWDGFVWRRVAASGPAPRVHHAMAYDEVRQRVLLYGGSDERTTFSDFWEWDGVS